MPIHMFTTTTTTRASVGSVRKGSVASIQPSAISATLTAPCGSSAREISRRLTNCGTAMAMTKQVRHSFLSLTTRWLMTTAKSIPRM